GVLKAVGLGADMVHRTERLGITDSTTDAQRRAIAQAEQDQSVQRSAFVTWAGQVLARTG
ncbi:hypothetical protein ACPC54_41435, partial [Kitasatospora sp. NPDC094028]